MGMLILNLVGYATTRVDKLNFIAGNQPIKFNQMGKPFSADELDDWLITKIKTPTKLIKTQSGTLVLTNGLISREFSIYPDFTTIDYISHEKRN